MKWRDLCDKKTPPIVADGRRYPQRDRRVVVILIQHGLLILLAGVVNADAVDLLRVLTSYGGYRWMTTRIIRSVGVLLARVSAPIGSLRISAVRRLETQIATHLVLGLVGILLITVLQILISQYIIAMTVVRYLCVGCFYWTPIC